MAIRAHANVNWPAYLSGGGNDSLTRPERHGVVGGLAGRRPARRVHRRYLEAVRREGPQPVHRERGGVVVGEGAAEFL